MAKSKKVVIPLEISEISAEILPVIRRLFEPEQIELTLVAVAQPVEPAVMVTDAHMMALPPSAYTTGYDREEWEAYRQELKGKLELAANDLRAAGYKVYTVLLTGSPLYEIANFVERRNFDLLAMATYGRSGLNRLIYGSRAETLLRMVSVPMLLLRHQEDEPENIQGKLRRVLPPVAQGPRLAVVTGSFEQSAFQNNDLHWSR